MIKVVFFGSSPFSIPSLHAMHQDTNIEICYIVTKRDRAVGRGHSLKENIVALHAKKLGIPVIKVGSLLKDSSQLNNIEFFKVDYAIVVSFGYILPDDILCQLPGRFINLHSSLLPKYRGPAPIHSAIISGDAEIGNSIMVLESEVDSGPVLATEPYSISSTSQFSDVHDLLATKGAKLLVSTIKSHHSGIIKPVPQDHSKASFTKMIKKEDGYTNLEEDSATIYNKYRAFSSWPQLYTTVEDLERFLQVDTKIQDKSTLVKLKKMSLDNSKLTLESIQLPNKPAISLDDFLNGYKTK